MSEQGSGYAAPVVPAGEQPSFDAQGPVNHAQALFGPAARAGDPGTRPTHGFSRGGQGLGADRPTLKRYEQAASN